MRRCTGRGCLPGARAYMCSWTSSLPPLAIMRRRGLDSYFYLQQYIGGVLDATQGIRMQYPWCELISGRRLRP